MTDTTIVACHDVACSWAEVPHWHEGEAVYPLPPDHPDWTRHLLAGFEDDAHD